VNQSQLSVQSVIVDLRTYQRWMVTWGYMVVLWRR